MPLGNAEEVGRSLLAEVQEKGFDELLHSLQNESKGLAEDFESRKWFGLPALDRICEVFARQPPQKAARPPVVEISSAGPAAGKTHLLYLLAATTVLPSCVGGSASTPRVPGTVVVFDADGRFNSERMADIMCHCLHSTCTEDPVLLERSDGSDAISDAIFNALKHVHVIRPQSLTALLASIRDLPSYLFSTREHFSADRPLDLVLIDSISAFFWQDKLAEEVSQIEAELAQQRNATRSQAYRNLTEGVRELQEKFGCPVVVTSWGLLPARRTSGQAASFRPLLPAPWQNLCLVRLVVSRDAVKRFPPGMAVEEAKKDAENRQAVVDQGKFSAWVDEWASEDWADAVWRAIKAAPENSGFSFRIKTSGVDFGAAGQGINRGIDFPGIPDRPTTG